MVLYICFETKEDNIDVDAGRCWSGWDEMVHNGRLWSAILPHHTNWSQGRMTPIVFLYKTQLR